MPKYILLLFSILKSLVATLLFCLLNLAFISFIFVVASSKFFLFCLVYLVSSLISFWWTDLLMTISLRISLFFNSNYLILFSSLLSSVLITLIRSTILFFRFSIYSFSACIWLLYLVFRFIWWAIASFVLNSSLIWGMISRSAEIISPCKKSSSSFNKSR